MAAYALVGVVGKRKKRGLAEYLKYQLLPSGLDSEGTLKAVKMYDE